MLETCMTLTKLMCKGLMFCTVLHADAEECKHWRGNATDPKGISHFIRELHLNNITINISPLKENFWFPDMFSEIENVDRNFFRKFSETKTNLDFFSRKQNRICKGYCPSETRIGRKLFGDEFIPGNKFRFFFRDQKRNIFICCWFVSAFSTLRYSDFNEYWGR